MTATKQRKPLTETQKLRRRETRALKHAAEITADEVESRKQILEHMEDVLADLKYMDKHPDWPSPHPLERRLHHMGLRLRLLLLRHKLALASGYEEAARTRQVARAC
jgi:hypothetical protein